MTGKALLDSNVVLYAYSDDARADRADELLTEGPAISVQTLNEFVNVARRKLKLNDDEVEDALADIIIACKPIHAITLSTHVAAFGLSCRYGFKIYDALIVAVALEAGCDTVFSEDMQDGLVVEGRLTIRDPFA